VGESNEDRKEEQVSMKREVFLVHKNGLRSTLLDGSAMPSESASWGRASRCDPRPSRKINLILGIPVGILSEIKLIRTDTTLDLSQEAEKCTFHYMALFYGLYCRHRGGLPKNLSPEVNKSPMKIQSVK